MPSEKANSMPEPKARMKALNKKINIILAASFIITVISIYFLISRSWSAYAYRVFDRDRMVILVGEYQSKKDCRLKGEKKLSEGIYLTRNDRADIIFCGKYCLEIPMTTLSMRNIYCILKEK